MFDVLMKPSPSPLNISDLWVKVNVDMNLYRDSFKSVVPKAHILEDHAIEKYIYHLDNRLPLIVE